MKADGEEDPKRIVDLLSEIAKWSRFDGIQKARQVLSDNLKKDSEKIAYHHSDGKTSTEIAKLSGVSDFAVRSYWKKWASIGIVFPSEKFKGRYERTFSLEDFGIEVPSLKTIEAKTGPEPKSDEPKETTDHLGVESNGEKS